MGRQSSVRSVLSLATFVAAGAGIALVAQEPTYKNSVGMEFVLIKPGKFVLGRFQPSYAKPVDPNAPPPAAAAGPIGTGTMLAPGMITLADANTDQKLSRVELVALAGTWFDQLDPDKTGKVSQADFATRFTAIQNQVTGRGGRGAGGAPGAGPSAVALPAGSGGPGGGGPGRGGGGGRGGIAPTLFTAVDANRDGSVTRDEMTALFGKWFDAWDSAKVGSLSSDQLVAGLNAALPMPAGLGGRGGTPPTPDEYKRIEEAALKDSSKGFEVTIPRAYYLGKYEVTQAQYKQVMGTNPSVFQGSQITEIGDAHPVDNVTWSDAQAFVRKLNTVEKTSVYRLPTEFEWEYAARAGADDDIPWSEIRVQAWNSGQTTQAVGKMQPNKWGLYDMLGNVWEWTQDYYNEKIFADPTPPKSGKEHVLKGGSFTADVKNLTYMWHGAGPGSKFDIGFRIVREVR